MLPNSDVLEVESYPDLVEGSEADTQDSEETSVLLREELSNPKEVNVVRHWHLHSEKKGVNKEQREASKKKKDSVYKSLNEQSAHNDPLAPQIIRKRNENKSTNQIASEIATSDEREDFIGGTSLPVSHSPVNKTSVRVREVVEAREASLINGARSMLLSCLFVIAEQVNEG